MVGPLRQPVPVAVAYEVAVSSGVHRGGELIVRHAQSLVPVVLKVPGIQCGLGVEVAHQTGNTVGIPDVVHQRVPDGFLTVTLGYRNGR